MINLQDRDYVPTLEEIQEYTRNEMLKELSQVMLERYKAKYQIEFSQCSWEHGWNIKFKKSGKTLCTIYPKDGCFTCLVVVGKKEKEAVEEKLSLMSNVIQEIYRETKEGNGQRWLMIDLEDSEKVYGDILKLIDIRFRCR